MTELDILKNAKACVTLLAKGIDPLTKAPVSENDVVKKTAIIKYFDFIAGVLEKNILTAQDTDRRFYVSEERIRNLKSVEEPITITKIAQTINAGLAPEDDGFIPSQAISYWLESQELLVRYAKENGYRRMATEKAIAYGMTNSYHINGNFKTVIYNTQAQQWIYDSINKISEFCAKHKEFFLRPEKAITQQQKQAFCLTPEQKENLHPFAPEVKISEITKYLNSFIDTSQVKCLKNGMISSWLYSEKLLTKSNYGKKYIPTPTGANIGIFCKNYTGDNSEYVCNIFTSQAQEYIFNHIDDLIEFNLLETE